MRGICLAFIFLSAPALAETPSFTTWEGHEDAVYAIAVSPDGKTVATASQDKTLVFWKTGNGNKLGVLAGHDLPVRSAVFTPDGKRVVSTAWGPTIKVWDAESAILEKDLKSFWKGHAGPVLCAAISRDGKRLLTGGADGLAKIWDLGSGKVLKTLEAHAGYFSDDSLPGTECRNIQESCRELGKYRQCTAAHTECALGVTGVAFTPDGQLAVTGGGDGTIKIWNAQTGDLVIAGQATGEAVLALALSPDGLKTASAHAGGSVRLWKTSTGELLATWTGHSDHVTAVAFSPDGKTVLSGSSDRTVRFWDAATGRSLATLTGHPSPVSAVAFTPDGSKALTGALDGSLKAWDVGLVLGKPEEKPAAKTWVSALPKPKPEPPPAEPPKPEPPKPEPPKPEPPKAEPPQPEPAKPELPPAKPAPKPADPLAAALAEEDEPLPEETPAEPEPPRPAEPMTAKVPAPVPVAEPPKSEPVLPAAAQPAAPAAAGRKGAPASLSMEVSFVEPSGNEALDIGEKAFLRVTINNAGPGPAFGLKLTASASGTGVKLATAAEIGDIGAGFGSTRELPVSADETASTGPLRIEIAAAELNGFEPDPVTVELDVRRAGAARLELAGVQIEGNAAVKSGEVVPVTVIVRNAGAAPAEGVTATLNTGHPDIVASGETAAELGALKPGETKKASFEIFVKKRYKGEKALPVSVDLAESSGKHGVKAQVLDLVLGERVSASKVIAFKGKQAPEPAPAPEDVDTPPDPFVPVDPNAYGVVIGIEKYRQDGIPPVDYAAHDAQAVYDYMTRSMGFDAKNVVLLQNEHAAKSDLVKYLGSWLKNRVNEKSKVMVFYAGHGSPDPKNGDSYLIPYDGDPGYAEDTAYPVKRLYASLAQMPTQDVVVALDACFSGAGGRSVMAKGARPLVTKQEPPPVAPNTVVLSATGGEQISTYYPEAQHGLMTYWLLKGLRGGADADGDGAITTAELFKFVQDPVEREARKQNVEQTPTLQPPPDQLGERASRVWLRTRPAAPVETPKP